jgi:SAM-dependent methyltransferase
MTEHRQIDYAAHYKKWHDHSDPAYIDKMDRYFFDTLRNVLPADKNAPILELGCSNGMALLSLHKAGYTSLKGIDSCSELVNTARSFSLDAEVADAFQFLKKSPAGHFSLIYMIDVLEHVPTERTLDLLSLAFETLAPEGTLFLQVPNASCPVGLHFRYIDWTHYCSFTTHSISDLLESAGFREIGIGEAFPPREPRREDFLPTEEGQEHYSREHFKYRSEILAREVAYWTYKRMLPDASDIPLTPNICVVARKKPANAPLSIQVKTTRGKAFDLQEMRELVDANFWKTTSILEPALAGASLKIQALEEQHTRLEPALAGASLKIQTLEEQHALLAAELNQLKNRNFAKLFFRDLRRASFNAVRKTAALLKKSVRPPSRRLEEMVNREWYGTAQVGAADTARDGDFSAEARPKWIRDLLQCPKCASQRLSYGADVIKCRGCKRSYRTISGRPVFHDDLSINRVDPDRQGFELPQAFLEMARKNGGLSLNMGCGPQPANTYFMVDFDYILCPNTDVVGDGMSLPFRDETFQTVISLNVFEHLSDPVKAASELGRVCKKGGQIIIHTAFLQPQHDFAHYYNATRAGVSRWFTPYFEETSCTVSENFSVEKTVAWTAHDFMRMVRLHCPQKTVERFEAMTLLELERIWTDLWSSESREAFELVRDIPDAAQGDVALGFEFIGVKK